MSLSFQKWKVDYDAESGRPDKMADSPYVWFPKSAIA